MFNELKRANAKARECLDDCLKDVESITDKKTRKEGADQVALMAYAYMEAGVFSKGEFMEYKRKTLLLQDDWRKDMESIPVETLGLNADGSAKDSINNKVRKKRRL